jgi:SprT protein
MHTETIQQIVNACFQKILGYVPAHRIQYRSIGRGIAGTASYATSTLTFDPFYIEQNPKAYMARTVPHEVAHLLTRMLYPEAKQHHGPEWRAIMKRLGAEATTYHSYDTTNAPGRHARDHVYKCACRQFNLTKKMHNSIQNGNSRRCLSCKGSLTYVG